MIYTGLTQAEIHKLETLLSEIGVPYEIHVNGEKLEGKQPRTGASVFELEIDDEALRNISTQYHARLERFGIYPHAEVPEELLKTDGPEKMTSPKVRLTGWKKWISWQGLVLLLLGALYIKKRMHSP